MPENKDICEKCQGRCCKSMSGIYNPNDFKTITVESILEYINNGNISIDWWEGDVRPNINELAQTYYLRPRHKGADIIDPGWGGECTFLTDQGCKLVYSNRPQNCRDLMPNIDHTKCNLGSMSKAKYITMWLPYQDILVEVHDQL